MQISYNNIRNYGESRFNLLLKVVVMLEGTWYLLIFGIKKDFDLNTIVYSMFMVKPSSAVKKLLAIL